MVSFTMASHATYPGDNFVWMSRFIGNIKVRCNYL
nr:MAG TPA: hypothetical protein [Caudoviricetes sp.]